MTMTTEVRERPVLFSGPMVRAILEGRKTITRRVITKTVTDEGGRLQCFPGAGFTPEMVRREFRCPYGRPGDRLWVRETWAHYQTVNYRKSGSGDGRAWSEVSDGHAGYRADGFDSIEDFRNHVRLMSGVGLEAVEINGDRWRPSIHMPRWASRITLEITDVRVERLAEITEDDATAEGIEVDMLCELLRPAAAKAAERKAEHWIGGDDASQSYCHDCATKRVAELVAAGSDAGDVFVDGGWSGAASDHRPQCESCGCPLDGGGLTDYGVDSEIEHFTQHGIRGAEDAYDFLDMIDCGHPRLTKSCGNFYHMPELAGPIARIGFRYLWDSLNAERGYGWDANPWVWVISFRRLDAPHAR